VLSLLPALKLLLTTALSFLFFALAVISLGIPEDDEKRTRGSLIIGQRQRPAAAKADVFVEEDEGRILAQAAAAAQAQALQSINANLVVSPVPVEGNNNDS